MDEDLVRINPSEVKHVPREQVLCTICAILTYFVQILLSEQVHHLMHSSSQHLLTPALEGLAKSSVLKDFTVTAVPHGWFQCQPPVVETSYTQ